MADGFPSAGNRAKHPPNPRVTREVERSLRYCHAVTRQRARNFYYGLKLTPEPKRSALFAVYAYMRLCDDLVDGVDGAAGVGTDAAAGLARIDAFARETDAAIAGDLPEGPMWPALHHVVHAYRIQPRLLHEMLKGQQMDLVTRRYATFDDLYGYCYRVASVVGLVCLDVWGHDEAPGTPQLAEYRGIAFQLTNVLRDLAEDAQRDRIYLPREDLDRFGVSQEQLLAGESSEGFVRLVQFEVERARSYYEMAETLERHLSPDCRATSWTMTQIYRRLLERIAADPAAVLRRRVRLSSLQKLRIALRGMLKNSWG